MCVPLYRWVHAVCESLYTEDEVEQASDEGFACTSCTPYVPKPVGKWLNLHRGCVYMGEGGGKDLKDLCTYSQQHNLPSPLYHVTFISIVVESAIMASMKIKEPGELATRVLERRVRLLISVFVIHGSGGRAG